jgi:hypothetical protein
MATRSYNAFYPWVKQDDYLTGWANFIEHKNVDGLRDGYWITLWPLVSNQLLTSTSAMRAMEWSQVSTWDTSKIWVWWDNWHIYNLDSVDNTPEHTLSAGQHIVQVVQQWDNLFFFTKDSYAAKNMKVAYILASDAALWLWWTMNEALVIWISVEGCPPILVVWTDVFAWGSWYIHRITSAWLQDSYAFPDDDVFWLTLQGSTVVVYSQSWTIYFWDWGSTSENARTKLGSRVQKVTQISNQDFVTTEDGQLYIWSGYTYQRITKPKRSLRLEDNSTLTDKLKFINDDTGAHQNKTMISARDDIYMYASDTTKWIYKYWNILPWLPKGLHKIISENYAGTQIDYIYDFFYFERTINKLFFSYKAGTTYGVDFIDLETLTTSTDWYIISDVFSWGTSFKKKINTVRVATSNTASTNTVILSYRINNWSWEVLRTISEDNNTIIAENIHKLPDGTSFKQFIDIQFKVEFHSDDGDNTPPTLHEFMLDYDIIWT